MLVYTVYTWSVMEWETRVVLWGLHNEILHKVLIDYKEFNWLVLYFRNTLQAVQSPFTKEMFCFAVYLTLDWAVFEVTWFE